MNKTDKKREKLTFWKFSKGFLETFIANYTEKQNKTKQNCLANRMRYSVFGHLKPKRF